MCVRVCATGVVPSAHAPSPPRGNQDGMRRDGKERDETGRRDSDLDGVGGKD